MKMVSQPSPNIVDSDAAKKGGAPKIVDADAAKNARALLDVVSLAGTAASALCDIKTKMVSGASPTQKDVRDLETVISSLRFMTEGARRATAKVSPVPYLLRAYDFRARHEQECFLKEHPPPPSTSLAMWKLSHYVKHASKQQRFRVPLTELPSKSVAKSPTKRQSTRKVVVSPDERKKVAAVTTLLKGRPPYPLKAWTKESLAVALGMLEGTRKTKQFIRKIISLGNSPYASANGIYAMYRQWKIDPIVRNRGRPLTMTVTEAEAAVGKVLKDRTSSCSAFVLENMNDAYASKLKDKAEIHGLDAESVSTNVDHSTSKAMTLAAAMGVDVGRATTKTLLTKTETRFQSEHSLMMGYAYATTVLATHFIEGPVPKSLAKLKMDELSEKALETMDWMKKALGADSIYPVNPNLLFSTDDTVFFAFEGTKNKQGEWEWKIVPGDSAKSNVRSDFQVGDDAENSGGLRVRLTFTFTASGLAAPPYIAVSGLTDAELCPDLCPDGILATKVKGLCKGGDNIHDSGFGWLVFLRADKKGSNEDDNAPSLSIANKKFIHYNDDVLMPFIREIRKTFDWKPGQDVSECLKAVSWFNGDIGQLQTMCFEARQAMDETERICRNKHSAAATGTQQPCDLSPVFRLLRHLQNNSTAVGDNTRGLAQTIDNLFAVLLRRKGLNLNGNRRKKRALIDFLLCLPELLEAVLKKRHIRQSFVEAGMIDEQTGMVPVFDRLIGTCKRWVSIDKDVGISKEKKEHCRSQFQALMRLQLAEGQLTYPDMKELGIPLGTLSNGMSFAIRILANVV